MDSFFKYNIDELNLTKDEIDLLRKSKNLYDELTNIVNKGTRDIHKINSMRGWLLNNSHTFLGAFVGNIHDLKNEVFEHLKSNCDKVIDYLKQRV